MLWFQNDPKTKKYARDRISAECNFNVVFLGYMHGPSAEGALKMKEHCGIHTEACLSGELGSLSIVDTKQIATIMVVSKDSVHHVSPDNKPH